MPAPTNIIAENAINIATLPYTTTQDAYDSGTTYPLWYKYTAQPGDHMIGWWAYPPTFTGPVYVPHSRVFAFNVDHLGDFDYLEPYLYPGAQIAGDGTPMQIPVVPGRDYYFKIEPNTTPITPAVVTIDVIRHVEQPIAAGDIIVNDDTPGFPAAVIDPVSGDVKAFIQLAAGEAADVIPSSGIMAFEDLNTDNVVGGGTGTYGVTLYTRDHVKITSIVVEEGRQISSNRVDAFYLAKRGAGAVNATIRKIDTTGATLATWTLPGPGLVGLAPSPDESILYIIGQGGTTNLPVQRRTTLGSGAAAADLAPGIPGYSFMQDLLVLSDGSVLVGYSRISPRDGFVKRYAADGTVLNTYALGADVSASSTIDRLAHAIDSPDSFMVWTHLDDGTSRFIRIRVSDGTVISTTPGRQFETGNYQGAQTLTPDARFGHSFSCPFVVAAAPSPVEPPPAVGPSEPIHPPPPSGCDCPTPSSPDTNAHGNIGGGDGPNSGDNPGGVLPQDNPLDESFPPPPCESSGGEAIANADSPARPSLDGVVESQFWMNAHYTNSEGADVRLLWSLHHPIPDPPEYQFGLKLPKLRAVGQLTRALSNSEGDFVGTSVSVTADDSDREMHAILADLDVQYLNGAETSFLIVPEDIRRMRGDPVIMNRGVLRGYNLGARLSSALQVEDLITSEYGPLGSNRLISDRKVTQGLFAGCPPQNLGKPQQMILGAVGDWGAYDPATGESREKGQVSVTTVGGRSINGEQWTEMLVAAHAVVGVDVYGANPENTKRVKIDESLYGTYVLAPGHTGWTFPTVYFDYLDTETGKTHRVTTIFVRGYIADSHLNGQINVAVNVCGMEEIGDGTGRMITGYFHAWQTVCDNWIFRRPGYYTGNYLGAPLWSDGTPLTLHSSFMAAQALSARWIGGEGYQIGAVVEGGILSKEVMKRFAVTAHCNYAWTMDGRFFVSLPDDTMDVSATPRLFAPFEIRTSTAPSYTHDSIKNPIFYNYDFDYEKGTWRGPQRDVRDNRAIDRTGRLERPATVDCYMSRDPRTVRDARSRELLWNKYPRPVVSFEMPVGGINYELGSVVRINGRDGEGNGWVDAPTRITQTRYDPKRRRTVLDGIVMSSVLGNRLVFSTADPVQFHTGPGAEEFRT